MSLVASRSVDLCECKNHIIQYLRQKHRDMFKTDWHHYMDITTEIEPNYTLPIIKTCLSQLELSGQIESNNCGEFRLISRSSVWLDHQKCTNIVDEIWQFIIFTPSLFAVAKDRVALRPLLIVAAQN